MLRRRINQWRGDRHRLRIDRLLAGGDRPQPIDDPRVFEELQQAYPSRTAYGYDAFNAWKRGALRAPELLSLSGLVQPGARVLDAACGDGMTGVLVASFGHEVTLQDMDDWRDDRAKRLTLVRGSLSEPLPIDDDQFDLVFSYNAFEHLDDPTHALKELVRVCKPSGLIYLDFGPLFASPWGLHAYRTVHMPYAQFLFSDQFLQDRLRELGIDDLGRQREELQPLNRWRASQFQSLWEDCGCQVAGQTIKRNHQHLDLIDRFPAAFRGRGLTADDYTIEQLDVQLRKLPVEQADAADPVQAGSVA